MRVFVVGCGRTGTTWMGRILASHPEIKGLVEDDMTFPWVRQIALKPDQHDDLLPEIIRRYRVLGDLAAPSHFSAKDHPALWIVDDLANAFPDAKFVAMQRNPFATVASMLLHDAVLQISKDAHMYPFPNPFAGLTEENVERFWDASIEERCAARWMTHTREICRLETKLGVERFWVVQYENLIDYHATQLLALRDFLGLKEKFSMQETPDRAPLTKWQRQLTTEQVRSIAAMTDWPSIKVQIPTGEML